MESRLLWGGRPAPTSSGAGAPPAYQIWELAEHEGPPTLGKHSFQEEKVEQLLQRGTARGLAALQERLTEQARHLAHGRALLERTGKGD